MRDPVFIKANSQLDQRRMMKQDRDPIEDTTYADAVENEHNEWITGIVPEVLQNADEPEDEHVEVQQEEPTSVQARARGAALKRKKVQRPRKKKLLPVFHDDDLQSATSTDSDDDVNSSSSSD
jgi:hypothetical protein